MSSDCWFSLFLTIAMSMSILSSFFVSYISKRESKLCIITLIRSHYFIDECTIKQLVTAFLLTSFT